MRNTAIFLAVFFHVTHDGLSERGTTCSLGSLMISNMDVEQLFRNLRKEAECPLCLETVNDPKTLPCLHSFCLLCLDKHALYARRQLQTTIKCPACLTSFQIPEGDTFGGLPTSFHLNRLVDLLALRDGSAEAQSCDSCDENNTASCYCFVCQNFLCAACFAAHQRLKATRGHRNILVENLQAQDVQELIRRPVMCSQQYHEEQALEYYCEECKVCICHKCSVVSHNRHSMVDMQKAADEHKVQIADALEKVKTAVAVYENQVKKEKELMHKSRLEISAAQRKMTETVDNCIRILREHKSAMSAKFDEINQAQQKAHATQLENFQFAVTQLKSSVEQGENILKRNINAEILQAKQAIIGRCEELLNARKPEMYKPPHVHYMVENMTTISDRVIVVVSNTDSSLSIVEGRRDTEEKTETCFTIITRDSNGIQCYNKDDDIKVDIESPTGSKSTTEITDSKDGRYTVTYRPECVGQYRVGIEINGQPLTGSPWSAQVVPHQYKFLFKFGSNGNGPGQFHNISDIAVSEKTGTIAIADCENNRIQLFSSDGNYLREIKMKTACFTVDFTKSGDIIAVVLEEDNKISLFTESGQFIKYINDEHIEIPFHLSVGFDDRIIACDWETNEIRVISPDGMQLLQSFRVSDREKSLYCTVYHQDRFFVSDYHANCIKVFSEEGEFLYNIGSEGPGDGELNCPAGLAIDKFNNLIVCDEGNKSLQIFRLDGTFVTKIEEHFSKNDGTPNYVAVSNDGHVFVTDISNDCVQVFQ